MKAIALILFSLVLTDARASYEAIHCSNSMGTVNWESGDNSNTINLKYANFVEGTLTLDMNQVDIQFAKEITLSEKKIRNCDYSANTRVYAGRVKIKAASSYPDVLRGQFPENKVETEVICTHHRNAALPCPFKE